MRKTTIARSRDNLSLQLLLIAIICTILVSVEVKAQELFEDSFNPIARASDLDSWAEVVYRMAEQDAELESCLQNENLCAGRLKSVRHLIARSHSLTVDQKIRLVNRYINRFTRYRDDRRREIEIEDAQIYVRQQWSTLLEFLRVGGDCEDYATAKYQLFRRIGFTPEQLRVIVVYDRAEREYHAIIGVAYGENEIALLDTDNQVYRKRPPGYRYIYAVNENHVWDLGLDTIQKPNILKRLDKKQ